MGSLKMSVREKLGKMEGEGEASSSGGRILRKGYCYKL